jgi:predicted RND superfamily exporter protein
MSSLKSRIIEFSIRRYRWIAVAITLFTLGTGAFFPWITMDTDPENMLEQKAPVRVFHNESKKNFNLSEIIVVGVVNESHPDGVFTPETLARVFELTRFATSLRWENPDQPGSTSGVIEADIIAPSVAEHMAQNGPGSIRFEWLMPRPPTTREEALAIRDKALSNPLLQGQMISEDGKALCLYLPLTDKLLSYKIYTALQGKIKELGGDEQYHIAGLPVAECAVGVEMFTQMTVAAPLTMVFIFGLLYFFFRRLTLILLPMIVATVAVVSALGLMIAFGHPVHILSSMLPIFLMPIAICDSVHILSDFFESYTQAKGRGQTIREVMGRLFAPLLYTSLTTAAGFLSFVTTSIPPARVFGVFVALGVIIAWGTTVLLIPAYIMLIPERALANFGQAARMREKTSFLTRWLHATGRFAHDRAKLVLAMLIALIGVAVWGMTQINVNDNYAKRFATSHPIRQADTALNSHFAGTYSAYMVLKGNAANKPTAHDVAMIKMRLLDAASGMGNGQDAAREIADRLPALASQAGTMAGFLDLAARQVESRLPTASGADADALVELKAILDLEKESLKPFKRPDVLEYMAGLQAHLQDAGLIGKSTSLADVVRKVHQELIDGSPENHRIPSSVQGVAECCMQYQQSHRPHDLWHFVTPDFMQANIMLQFPRGDSSLTEQTVRAADAYMAAHKPPTDLTVRWAGLHYVNLHFQETMFWEMLGSFGGSFLIVFVMMTVLFRSVRWAALCMLPLTLTIGAIYGLTGLVGKDYDMPVAVLSAISLGIAVDFAIHFLERSRELTREFGSWEAALPHVFGEPGLAITRNVLVVALGFLPLMVAQLMPYKTTAVLLFGILAVSGLMTLVALPAVLTLGQRWFFRGRQGR